MMGFFGDAHRWGEGGRAKRLPSLKFFLTDLTMMKLGAVIAYLKKTQKII